MGGRRQYFRRSSLWHCQSSNSFAATSASGSPDFEVAYPAFPLPTRALPAVQSLTLPFQQFLCRRQHFQQSSLWHCLSSISFANTSTTGSPVFDITYQAFPLLARALPAVQPLTLPIQHFLCRHEHFRQSSLWHRLSSQPVRSLTNIVRKKKKKKPGSLQTFLICAAKGENWKRKDSNL